MEYHCYYDDCRIGFKTKFNLVRHINARHLQIRNFACGVCQKRFRSKQHLNSHCSLHSSRNAVEAAEYALEDFCEASVAQAGRCVLPKISISRQGSVILPTLAVLVRGSRLS